MSTWDKLPLEIQELMLEHQVEEDNPRNPEVFKKDIFSSKNQEGFRWAEFEGYHFWHNIIVGEIFTEFYEKYPEKLLIKPEYKDLYKKTFRVNRIINSQVDMEKIRELNLEHILVPGSTPNNI